MDAVASALRHAPISALPLLFLAGVATSFTPCIYPMIPITAGLLARPRGATSHRPGAVATTLMYVLGLSLLYACLGLLAGLTHTLFGAVSSNRWALLLFANVLLVAALAMLDVIPVQGPTRLVQWAATLAGDSLTGAFLMGATAGVVAAPCGAPAFAAVLTWVAQTQNAVWGFISLFIFSLGMTAVLVAVGLISGAVSTLPRSGTWMIWIKRAAGIIMLAMSEYYLIKAGEVW